MQWNTGMNAGFTDGTPWLKVNPNHVTVNVESAEKDPNSILNYFRKMIRLRKSEPALIYGKFDLLAAENPDVFAYTRSLEGRTLLVALSFSTKGSGVALPAGLKAGKLLINNLTESPVQGNNLALKPFQAVVLEGSKGRSNTAASFYFSLGQQKWLDHSDAQFPQRVSRCSYAPILRLHNEPYDGMIQK